MDFIAELFYSACEALGSSIQVEAGEIERTQIVIRHLIALQIVSGGKDGSGHCQDSFLWTAASSQP